MKLRLLVISIAIATFTSSAIGKLNDSEPETQKPNKMIQDFGPQSPRDIDNLSGKNSRFFSAAPEFEKMNLCNIHFHKNAEHKGGEFTEYAGDGEGYKYNKKLSQQELKPFKSDFDIKAGDTIEVHYVHSTANVAPGSTLAACLSKSISNPQLRVEAQIYVLVNDSNAQDFIKLTETGVKNGYYQALNIPSGSGVPVTYAGSTTGPSYNDKNSPLQVTWSVRPKVVKVNIESVDKWLRNNEFDEDHAHGIRNIITDPYLLSPGH